MITIHKSATADTRTCDFINVTKDQLRISSVQHIGDVSEGLMFFEDMLDAAAVRHDFDKLTDIDGFHADFVTGFKQTGWWDRHRGLNRHHLLQPDGVPADVNLIDVLDMIVDCVMAGMGRAGSVYPLDIKPEVLKTAFDNTVELLKAQVVVDTPPETNREAYLRAARPNLDPQATVASEAQRQTDFYCGYHAATADEKLNCDFAWAIYSGQVQPEEPRATDTFCADVPIDPREP
jgi:hypothetical protein